MNIKYSLKKLWLEAMGVPWHGTHLWAKGRFRSLPEKCIKCGRKMWPYREDDFVAVLGKYDGRSWHCKQLNLTLNTGWAQDHIRYICKYCVYQYGFVRDVLMNEVVSGERLNKWIAGWKNVKYWARVTMRFPGIAIRQVVFIVLGRFYGRYNK